MKGSLLNTYNVQNKLKGGSRGGFSGIYDANIQLSLISNNSMYVHFTDGKTWKADRRSNISHK